MERHASEREEVDSRVRGAVPSSSSPSAKLGLRFILSEREPSSRDAQASQPSLPWLLSAPTGGPGESPRALARQLEQTCSIDGAEAHAQKRRTPATPVAALSAAALGDFEDPSRPPSSAGKKRGSRTCRAQGCDNYSVLKGLCCRHGGGKKCSSDDCESSAKHGGRCWKHGGSVECKIPDCTKKAKARGLCWAHGGGAKCQADACAKVAISNGFCWAHGGGKRCIFDGCQRPAFERTHSFCLRHYDALQDIDYYEV